VRRGIREREGRTEKDNATIPLPSLLPDSFVGERNIHENFPLLDFVTSPNVSPCSTAQHVNKE
jgi:hypothetical protein